METITEKRNLMENMSKLNLNDSRNQSSEKIGINSKCNKEVETNETNNDPEIFSQTNLSANMTSQWITGGSAGSRNAVLVFKSSSLAEISSSISSVNDKPAAKLHVTYKVLQAESKLLAKLLECHGVTEVAPNSTDFNLLWTGSHPKPGILRSLAPHQRVNHFPRSYELTRKDRLYKNIEKMQQHYLAGSRKPFDFIPRTFVIPAEYKELASVHHRIKGPWIVKPVASSRGRGIFIVENPNRVPLEEPLVVAKYITDPLLVEGHKCDLRLYVVVTSFDPLLIYIYEEGLVRFATVKYDPSHKQLWNPCMHLCNYSINKYHSDYVKSDDPSVENIGHKWTLSALLRHLKAEGRDTGLLMSRIEDVVVKAVLSSAQSIVTACKMFVPHPSNCFELFGFDILIDTNLKPWLLEVNLSPSLNCDSPLDLRVKSAMLSDLLTLVGIPAVDPILRPVSSATTNSTNSLTATNLKIKINSCRRVHSADEGLSNNNNNGKKGSTPPTAPHPPVITAEIMRMIKIVQAQFERRGGFVRIFPAADSWSRYSQYLDPVTGLPNIDGPAQYSFCNRTTQNFNFALSTFLFPNECVADVKTSNGSRQDRYEGMLHRQFLPSSSAVLINKVPQSAEVLRKNIVEMLKNGKKITQFDARKTFSRYLFCILKKIVTQPSRRLSLKSSEYGRVTVSDDNLTDHVSTGRRHVEIVSKFLQKASNYLRTPYIVKAPSTNLETKDRAAIVAKQLDDFLFLYNRETQLYASNVESNNTSTANRADLVPGDLYQEFLLHARECDLEQVLIYQTANSNNTPLKTNEPLASRGAQQGFQDIIKCISNSGTVIAQPSSQPKRRIMMKKTVNSTNKDIMKMSMSTL